MKKEVFFAIFLGFVLGLIITFGIWTANKSLKQANIAVVNPQPTTSASPTAGISPTPSSAISITLTSPADESISTKSSVTLEGKTLPRSVIALYYELGEQFITSNSSGEFTASIPLENGYNFITVTAYDDKGNSSSQDLTVTYTTQKI